MIRANSFLGGKVYFRVVGELTRYRFKKPLEDVKDLSKDGKVLNKEPTLPGFKKPLEGKKNLMKTRKF